jgi:hypothetical protein
VFKLKIKKMEQRKMYRNIKFILPVLGAATLMGCPKPQPDARAIVGTLAAPDTAISKYDMGSANLSESKTSVIVITNKPLNGGVPLILNSISVLSPFSTDSSKSVLDSKTAKSGECANDQVLNTGESCSISITFTPLDEGRMTRNLSVGYTVEGKSKSESVEISAIGTLNCDLDMFASFRENGISVAEGVNQTNTESGTVAGQALTFDDGYNPAYDSSFSSSYSAAYDPAYNTAYTSAYNTQYSSSYDSSYHNVGECIVGALDGNISGSADGDAAGYNDGYADGFPIGQSQGATEGFDDGYADGLTTGRYDGSIAGGSSGNTDGYNTGYDDGAYSQSGIDDGYDAGLAQGVSDGYPAGVNSCYENKAIGSKRNALSREQIKSGILKLVSSKKKDKGKSLADAQNSCYDRGYNSVIDLGAYTTAFNAARANNAEYTSGSSQGSVDGAAQGGVDGLADGQSEGARVGKIDGQQDGTNDGTSAIYADCFQPSYNIAFADKYSDGYDHGYDSGRDAGFEESYSPNYVSSFNYYYDIGFDEGFADTYSDAFDLGLSQGQADIYAYQYNAYVDVGYSDGWTAGFESGRFDECGLKKTEDEVLPSAPLLAGTRAKLSPLADLKAVTKAKAAHPVPEKALKASALVSALVASGLSAEHVKPAALLANEIKSRQALGLMSSRIPSMIELRTQKKDAMIELERKKIVGLTDKAEIKKIEDRVNNLSRNKAELVAQAALGLTLSEVETQDSIKESRVDRSHSIRTAKKNSKQVILR